MLRLSAKQKREVYSISSLLLHLLIFIALLITLNSCGLKNQEDTMESVTHSTLETIEFTRKVSSCSLLVVSKTALFTPDAQAPVKKLIELIEKG